jgi:hypothetical protein
MGKKAPKAPDPMQTAQQASGLSKENQIWNAQQQWGQNQKAGPFGSVTTDPNTGAQTQQFGAGLLPSVNNTQGALGQQTAGLPAGFNFDMTTPMGIAAGNYGAYSAMTAPQREQMQNQLKTTMSERGIPEFSQNGDFGSDIAKNAWGNLNQQFALADTNAAAQAWNAVPGMQAQMTNTAIAQGLAPGQQAGQSLGLLQGANSLLPGYNPQYQFGAADPANAYLSTTNNNYNQAMQQYNANQAGVGNLLKTVGSIGMNAIMPGSGALMGGGGAKGAPQGFPQSGVWNPAPTNFNWGGGGY